MRRLGKPRINKVTKQFLKRKLFYSKTTYPTLELHDEPMIYSVKYSLGTRITDANIIRNMKYLPLLRAYFPPAKVEKVPVVLRLRFFVTPPKTATDITRNDLRREDVPAARSFELCEYILSVQDMLNNTMINSHRQIVRMEVDKYYSDRPRTLIQLIKWDHYVELQNNDTFYSKAKGFRPPAPREVVQSFRQGDVKSTRIRKKYSRKSEPPPVTWPPPDNHPLQATMPDTADKKARRKLPAPTALEAT